MDDLIEQAEYLVNLIKSKEREIDNPSLVLGTISQLDFFIENLEED